MFHVEVKRATAKLCRAVMLETKIWAMYQLKSSSATIQASMV